MSGSHPTGWVHHVGVWTGKRPSTEFDLAPGAYAGLPTRKERVSREDRAPMQMMETDSGGRLVEDMPCQIEHGIFA